jgi:hypothetical protein
MSQRKERPKVFSPSSRVSTASPEVFSQRRAQAWGNGNVNNSFQSKTIREEDEFGIKAYVAPRGEMARLPIPSISLGKAKKLSMFEEHAKRKTIVPAPNKYQKSNQ